MRTSPEITFPALRRDLRVDVALVGGGITGLTTAVLLKERGRWAVTAAADVVVVGGGTAGGALATELRRREWRREWDLNPRDSRPRLFKSLAFGRSAIPPGDEGYPGEAVEPGSFGGRIWARMSVIQAWAAFHAASASLRMAGPCSPAAG